MEKFLVTFKKRVEKNIDVKDSYTATLNYSITITRTFIII